MRFSFLLLLAVSFVSSALAATGTGNSTATILSSIAISATQDLAFGKLSAGTGGTVVLTTSGARSKTGGVTLVTTGSTQTQGRFHVTGDSGATYAITLPADGVVTLSDGASHTLAVGTFASNPNGSGTLTGGAQDIDVGATLTVANAQAAGAYTGAYSVVVDYN